MFKKVLSLLITVTFISSPVFAFAKTPLTPTSQDELAALILKEISSLELKEEVKTLSINTKGEEVATLQEFLVKEDVYPEAVISGYYGALTEKAVSRLHEKYNLEDSGNFNSGTYKEIEEIKKLSDLYVDLSLEIFNRDSFVSKTDIDLDMTVDMEDGTKVEVQGVLELEFGVDLNNKSGYFNFLTEGVADLGFFKQEFAIKSEVRYTDEHVYFIIKQAPEILLEEELIGQWVEVDISEFLQEFGGEIEEAILGFASQYEQEVKQQADLLKKNNVYIVDPKSVSIQMLEEYPREEIERYEVRFNIQSLLNFIEDAIELQDDEISKEFFKEFDDFSLIANSFADIIEESVESHIWILDKKDIVASEVMIDLDVNENDVFEVVSQFEEGLTQDDLVEGRIVVDLDMFTIISDINKKITVEKPEDTIDIEQYFQIVYSAFDPFGTFIPQASVGDRDAQAVELVGSIEFAMYILKDYVTNDYPSGKKMPVEDISVYSPNLDSKASALDINWEDNRYEKEKYCAWVQLEDRSKGRYYVASHVDMGYRSKKPDIDDCASDKYIEEQKRSVVDEATGKVDLEYDFIDGSSDAKVFVLEYSDFECIFCKKYNDTIGKQIREKYQDNKDVAFVFRHSPLDAPYTSVLHDSSTEQHLAASCVADLGGIEAFSEYTNRMYATSKSDGQYDLALLSPLTIGLGIEKEEFDMCYEQKLTEDILEKHTSDGKKLQVYGVPTILLQSQDVLYTSQADYTYLVEDIDYLLSL